MRVCGVVFGLFNNELVEILVDKGIGAHYIPFLVQSLGHWKLRHLVICACGNFTSYLLQCCIYTIYDIFSAYLVSECDLCCLCKPMYCNINPTAQDFSCSFQ
jgi:hypothetical protein